MMTTKRRIDIATLDVLNHATNAKTLPDTPDRHVLSRRQCTLFCGPLRPSQVQAAAATYHVTVLYYLKLGNRDVLFATFNNRLIETTNPLLTA